MSSGIYQLAVYTSCISDPKHKSVVLVLLFGRTLVMLSNGHTAIPTAFLNGNRQACGAFHAKLSGSLTA